MKDKYVTIQSENATKDEAPRDTHEPWGELTEELIIHRYSRADALRDGVLIDASKLAREAGLIYPVALTAAAWNEIVAVSSTHHVHDETGRLWDVLNVLRLKIRSSPGGSELSFFLTVCDENEHCRKVHVKSIYGPGDDWEPVITIMLSDED